MQLLGLKDCQDLGEKQQMLQQRPHQQQLFGVPLGQLESAADTYVPAVLEAMLRFIEVLQISSYTTECNLLSRAATDRGQAGLTCCCRWKGQRSTICSPQARHCTTFDSFKRLSSCQALPLSPLVAALVW